jgi:hypothetical protein
LFNQCTTRNSAYYQIQLSFTIYHHYQIQMQLSFRAISTLPQLFFLSQMLIQSEMQQSVLDQNSRTLKIRIWIGNPDPGSGSRGNQMKEKMYILVIFLLIRGQNSKNYRRQRYYFLLQILKSGLKSIKVPCTVHMYLWFKSNKKFKKWC